MAGCPLEIVSGNNEFFLHVGQRKGDTDRKIQDAAHTWTLYYVSAGLDTLRKEAYSRGMDIVMFGHTHRPLIEYDKELTVINPGSLSYPRQPGRKPSYIMMELDREGEAHFTIHYL